MPKTSSSASAGARRARRRGFRHWASAAPVARRRDGRCNGRRRGTAPCRCRCLTSSSGAQSTAAVRRRVAVPGVAIDAEMRPARGAPAGRRRRTPGTGSGTRRACPCRTASRRRRRPTVEPPRISSAACGIFIDADELAVDRGQHEGDQGPAAPAQPARDGAAAAVAAGELGQRAFRAEHAAPDAAHQHDGEDHEGPPDAPEQVLREQHQALVPRRGGRRLVLRRHRLARSAVQASGSMKRGGAEVAGEQPRFRMRVRQEGRQRDQHRVENHDDPLDGEDGAAMRAPSSRRARARRFADCAPRGGTKLEDMRGCYAFQASAGGGVSARPRRQSA